MNDDIFNKLLKVCGISEGYITAVEIGARDLDSLPLLDGTKYDELSEEVKHLLLDRIKANDL